MFSKSYKIKSTNTLKNSEKKQVVQRILNEFPKASEEKVKTLVPVKANCNYLKLVLSSGASVGVYAVDSAPLFLEVADALVPTVCALWQVPDLLPTIIIHSPVLSKVVGGAPLYLPGVVCAAEGAPCVQFPSFSRGALVAASTADNAAAALVGRATLSSGDMLLTTSGVCLETIHVYGDQLCKETKFTKIERPILGPASYGPVSDITSNIQQLSIQQPTKEEWPSLGRREPPPAPPTDPIAVAPAPVSVPNEPRLIPDASESENPQLDETGDMDNSQSEECSIPDDMDGLLRWCLLTFLKLEGKRLELPLKTNLLYRNHLIPLCPPDRSLDVKKSSYKKMGKFLDAMQQEGLVEVREVEKGVDALVAAQLQHHLLRAHRLPAHLRAQLQQQQQHQHQHQQHDDEPLYTPPLIREVYCVTAHVAELFAPHKKGTPLSAAEVHSCLTAYVKCRALHSDAQPGAVTLDALLARVMDKPEQCAVSREQLSAGVRARMTAGAVLQDARGDTRLLRARLEPVTMHVVTRSGNKKVTLVSNLESYGFSLPELSRVCQHGVAAACGVTRSPGARHDQLMLQGDQTHFVAKLLIEKYGLPKKYVDGADKALKKKK